MNLTEEFEEQNRLLEQAVAQGAYGPQTLRAYETKAFVGGTITVKLFYQEVIIAPHKVGNYIIVVEGHPSNGYNLNWDLDDLTAPNVRAQQRYEKALLMLRETSRKKKFNTVYDMLSKELYESVI